MINPNSEEYIKLFRYVYTELHSHGIVDSLTILAGGAVRDMILNKPVKDLDIFISTLHTTNAEEKFRRLAFKQKLSFINKSRDIVSNHYPDNFVVYDLVSLNGTELLKPVQIIFHNKPVYNLVASFDYEFCRAYMKTSGRIVTFNEFDYAIKTKICEYKSKPILGNKLLPVGVRERALSRIVQRHRGFKEKFPDFEFIGVD